MRGLKRLLFTTVRKEKKDSEKKRRRHRIDRVLIFERRSRIGRWKSDKRN